MKRREVGVGGGKGERNIKKKKKLKRDRYTGLDMLRAHDKLKAGLMVVVTTH